MTEWTLFLEMILDRVGSVLGLGHHLQSDDLLGLAVLHLPHLAEAAFPDDIDELKLPLRET
jgi:hypothetical protein